MTDPVAEVAVWAEIPEGYAALPLSEIPEAMAATGRLIDELGTAAQREIAPAALDRLGGYLRALAEADTVYCGVGRHASGEDGSLITSSLVVNLLAFPGERNPRLILRDLLQAKQAAEERGQADLVDLPNGPVLFVERTLTLAVPPLPGSHVLAAEQEASVWQLEAFVPSPAGDRLATIEVSTPNVADGPQFRMMTVLMAAGVTFEAPVEVDPLAALG